MGGKAVAELKAEHGVLGEVAVRDLVRAVACAQVLQRRNPLAVLLLALIVQDVVALAVSEEGDS